MFQKDVRCQRDRIIYFIFRFTSSYSFYVKVLKVRIVNYASYQLMHD